MIEFSFFNLLMNLLAIFVCIRNKLIPLMVIMGVNLFLITGQAIQISYDLSEASEVYYLTHIISRADFQLAQEYYCSYLLTLLFLAFFYGKRWLNSPCVLSNNQNQIKHVGKSSLRELFLLFFLIFLSFFLIFVVVGLSDFITSSRPGYTSGSTIFLVLLSIGLYPITNYLFQLKKPSRMSVLCFLITFVVTTAFSRIHSIIYILFVFYGWLFSNRQNSRNIFLLAKKFAPIFLLILFVFFGVGSIRDAMNYTHGSLSDILSYVFDNPESSLLSIRKNYIVGVEGMSGLAGAIRYYNLHSPYPDFALSSIARGLFQWFPSSIKDSYDFLLEYFNGFYFYKDSIVSSGIQDSFVSFLWAGGVVFAIFTFFIFVLIPSRLYKCKSFFSAGSLLLILSLSIFFIRGSWVVWVGYTVSYLIIYFLFSLVFFRNSNNR